MMRGAWRFGLLGLAVGLMLPQGLLRAQADVPAQDSADTIRAALPSVIKDLDSQAFEVRRKAAGMVDRWISQPAGGAVLAAEFQRLLLDPGVSFEVRWQVERWCRRLPDVRPARAKAISGEELDQLMAQLDDDSYAIRLGAVRRVQWLLQNLRLACAIMVRLKARIGDPLLAPETRRRIELLEQEARGAWLLSDPAKWDLAPVGDDQLAHWIDELVQPAQEQAIASAERELLDLLARDEYVPRVQRKLEERLKGDLDPSAAARLRNVLEWTRPAMVAEFWQGHKHLGEQHLLVDVPSMAEGAMRPSHFDRIDDRIAHCVSGNTLSPGDYPVHVAFPHPATEDAFFHLVNLPNPRRRMAYTFYVKRDSAHRLADISRRTLERILAEKRTLEDREIAMLGQLDYRELSRFAGRYFNLVPDEPNLTYRSGSEKDGLDNASHHGLICELLAVKGTKEAIPGLLQAIEKRRFLEPTSTPPCRLPWWAALSIATRDPWPGVEPWLSSLVGRDDLLIDGCADGPELGATAAALLAARCRELPLRHGLRTTPGPVTGVLATIDTYRFESPTARARFQQWWKDEGRRHLEVKAANPSPAALSEDDAQPEDDASPLFRLEPVVAKGRK